MLNKRGSWKERMVQCDRIKAIDKELFARGEMP